MNKKEIDFSVFCIESIAECLNINGRDVFCLFTTNSTLLDDYIVQNYETLHTQGKEYIVNDIIEKMKEENLLK